MTAHCHTFRTETEQGVQEASRNVSNLRLICSQWSLMDFQVGVPGPSSGDVVWKVGALRRQDAF